MDKFELDRHDRTWRFLQTAFPWADRPTVEGLQEVAEEIRVVLSVGQTPAGSRQAQLTALAVTNVVGRLPVGLAVRAPDRKRPLLTRPYEGDTLLAAVHDLGRRLDRPIELLDNAEAEAMTVDIQTPEAGVRWHLATNGWSAYLGSEVARSSQDYNPVSAYLAACMLGGEVLRTWAREVARQGAGRPETSFNGRAARAVDRWVNLWAPATDTYGPVANGSNLPPIDWIGAGAVNQATLAVLAAVDGWDPAGTVIDPKNLDPPDLNRSLLSFSDDFGKAKASVASEKSASGGLAYVTGNYPEAWSSEAAPWIVAGTDDVGVRADIQGIWPQRLVVTATEGVFGYVGWHAPERTDLPCAGCAAVEVFEPEERIPTSAPTSATAGVVTAATLLRLAAQDEVPAHTDILTLRMDAPHALDGSNPSPRSGCRICRSVHRQRRCAVP